ncbi:MAG: lysophospholipid acyltransferase family protein [Minisyncoccia bacterium]
MAEYYYYLPVFLQKIGYIVFFVLHKIFVRIEIRGRENLLDLKKPVILAFNHTSELDVTASPLVLGFFSTLYPIYYVTNPKEKHISFGWRNYIYGGVFFNVLGGYPIHSGYKDYETSLESFVDLLDNNQTVLIFPEGKRTSDGGISPARGGLGFLVYETEATVVPVCIDTFFDMTAWKFFGRQRNVVITILKPMTASELIKTDEPSVEDYREVSHIVLNRIEEALVSKN